MINYLLSLTMFATPVADSNVNKCEVNRGGTNRDTCEMVFARSQYYQIIATGVCDHRYQCGYTTRDVKRGTVTTFKPLDKYDKDFPMLVTYTYSY